VTDSNGATTTHIHDGATYTSSNGGGTKATSRMVTVKDAWCFVGPGMMVRIIEEVT
jgi:hypothetical protein